ncbi:unnamed protein product [Closterium sp. Naga37s-1]|nr:unnamed protein product [Closterium sp. Naga37s-1]
MGFVGAGGGLPWAQYEPPRPLPAPRDLAVSSHRARSSALLPPMKRIPTATLARLWSLAASLQSLERILQESYDSMPIIPVLRAGAVMAEQMGPVIPHTITYHLGYVRDETTLQPTLYLNKLPKAFNPEAQIIIVDAMLATGGTMMATMEEVVGRGANPDNIRIISAIVASPALKLLSEKYKGLRVYTGMIDADVNDQGYARHAVFPPHPTWLASALSPSMPTCALVPLFPPFFIPSVPSLGLLTPTRTHLHAIPPTSGSLYLD